MYKWQEESVARTMPLCVSDEQRNAVRDIIIAVNKFRFPDPKVVKSTEYSENVLLDWSYHDRRWTVEVDRNGVCAERFEIPGDLRGNTSWYRDDGFTLAMRRSAHWLFNGTPAFQSVAS